MAAPADASRPARTSRKTRRSERAPSGGWRTIASKELADHLSSVRFFVLLLVVAIAAVVPLILISGTITSQAPQLAGQPALFMALFLAGPEELGGITTVQFTALLVPLVGIAFGFDAVNSERSQGTLSRLLAQPVHRDDVVNGKFAAGIAVIALMIAAMVAFVAGAGVMRLGIIPSLEEVGRIVLWMFATVLYASFWLAFALLISVVVRSTATAALIGFGTWLLVTFLGQFVLPLLAKVFFPADTSSYDALFASSTWQHLFLRLSPAQLYTDIQAAVLNPSLASVLGPGNLGQAISDQERQASLLTLDQSILVVWPEIILLVALTTAMFALAYVLFLRQEVRA